MRIVDEGLLPLHEINHMAMTEKVKKDHPGNIHLWWNRSPVASSEMLMKATLDSVLPVEAVNVTDSLTDVTIVDPFCGSGCLTLAAMSTDMPVMAGDINSVAVVITKAITEYAARFVRVSPVSSRAELQMYSGLGGLAEDIRCYGGWIKAQLCKRLENYYPDAVNHDETGKQAYSWIWTRTVPCPNPACGCRMPLASSYVLSRQKGREYHVEPTVADDQVSFIVKPDAPEASLNGNKIGKQGAQFQCPKCGSITKDSYVKSMGQAGKLGLQLMAVGYDMKADGRQYVSPDERQESAAMSGLCVDRPAGKIPDNSRWFSPPLFGLKEYADLFTPRQLVLMTTLCDLVGEAQEQCLTDALSAGMKHDGLSLEDGGAGALAYSQAIALYLSLVVGKLANYQSEICTLDNRKGNLRAAFTRQAIPMTWTFAEGNPFSNVTGNYDAMLADVVTVVENLPTHTSAKVLKCDALQYPFPKNSVLFTELPYYDNVGYADLSDYFYVWLRKCLKQQLPEMFDQIASSKDELSSIPEHFGGDAQLAIKSYENAIHTFFKRFRPFATNKYPSIIFFEFGKQDEIAMSDTSGNTLGLSRWENLIDATIQAGFQITAILPVRTEMPSDSYETSRVAVCFKPRANDAPHTIRRSLVAVLKRELPVILTKQLTAEIDDWDKPIVGMGCGLALFSRYSHVLNADGSDMSTHDAMQLIWAEVSEYIKNVEPTVNKSSLEEETSDGRES